jgi:hypothetical protein
MSNLLPVGYETLEPFVEFWAVEGTANRDRLRSDSSEEQRVAFFEAAKGLVPQALEQLDKTPLKELDAAEQRLMNLLLSFAHAALAVEMQGKDEPRHAAFRKEMRITRSVADA